MPNWCSNYLTFQGSEKDVKAVEQDFKLMHDKVKETGHGQLPEWSKFDQDWFFGIYSDDFGQVRHESFNVQYETRWAPNIEQVLEIAKKHNLTFELEYEESGMLIYGRYVYDGKELKDYYLTDEEHDLYEWDEKIEFCTFEGKEWESDTEIKEVLLERKIKANQFEIVEL
jgi:hypothetical protein